MGIFGSRRSNTPPPDATTVVGEIIPPNGGTGPRQLDDRKVLAAFLGLVARIPSYVRLGWLLMNDPTVSGRGKAALGGGLAYAISPIDPVPGFIPVLGQLDDLAVLLLAVRTALRSAPTEVADRHLADVGLSWATLDRDLVILRATAIWVIRRGGGLAMRAGKAIFGMAAGRFRDVLPGRSPTGGAD